MSAVNDLFPNYTTIEETRKRVAWNAATPTTDPNFRIDCDGRLIRWADYGKLTEYGWEIDHIHPFALGGIDVPHNLRARHYSGNRKAGAAIGALLGSPSPFGWR